MKTPALEVLLHRLGAGDVAAAEQVFVAYEPYLRKVVRRLLPAYLRARFDSIDVVQSVWADLLDRLSRTDYRFEGPGQLRAFLVTVTRNRFLDRVRQHKASLAREARATQLRAAAQVTAHPAAPGDLAQAGELWQRMLALCPPAHRDVLYLKREGYALAEIAERTGLHVGTIRRILGTLARRLTGAETAAVHPGPGQP